MFPVVLCCSSKERALYRGRAMVAKVSRTSEKVSMGNCWSQAYVRLRSIWSTQSCPFVEKMLLIALPGGRVGRS